MHALLGLEAEFAIGDLHGDGDEDSVAGYAKKIGPIVHMDIVVDDLDGDQFGQTLEAFGRALDAEVAIRMVDWVMVGGVPPNGLRQGGSVGVGKGAGFEGIAI